jgi:hypothetical protein
MHHLRPDEEADQISWNDRVIAAAQMSQQAEHSSKAMRALRLARSAGRWQCEQIVAEPLRGRTWTSILLVVGTEASLVIDKSPEVMAPVKNSD